MRLRQLQEDIQSANQSGKLFILNTRNSIENLASTSANGTTQKMPDLIEKHKKDKPTLARDSFKERQRDQEVRKLTADSNDLGFIEDNGMTAVGKTRDFKAGYTSFQTSDCLTKLSNLHDCSTSTSQLTQEVIPVLKSTVVTHADKSVPFVEAKIDKDTESSTKNSTQSQEANKESWFATQGSTPTFSSNSSSVSWFFERKAENASKHPKHRHLRPSCSHPGETTTVINQAEVSTISTTHIKRHRVLEVFTIRNYCSCTINFFFPGNLAHNSYFILSRNMHWQLFLKHEVLFQSYLFPKVIIIFAYR